MILKSADGDFKMFAKHSTRRTIKFYCEGFHGSMIILSFKQNEFLYTIKTRLNGGTFKLKIPDYLKKVTLWSYKMTIRKNNTKYDNNALLM